MSSLQSRQMPKGYAALWGGLTLAYVVWLLFMRNIILVNYETVAERTVDGYLYSDITGMVGHHWLYPVWVVLSALSMLLYIVYIKKLLYADRLGNAAKWLCMIGAVVGVIYVVAFGFLDAPNRAGEPATMSDKLHYVTASMIGLVHPWLFKLWGILTGTTMFTNILYLYRKFHYNSKLGIILGSVGAAAIYLSLNCPSCGETKDFSDPRCLAHWLGALVFALCIASPIIVFLFSMARRERGLFLLWFIVAVVFLAVMLVLLIVVGKSTLIENLPVIGGFLLLFLLNFTHTSDTDAVRAEAGV